MLKLHALPASAASTDFCKKSGVKHAELFVSGCETCWMKNDPWKTIENIDSSIGLERCQGLLLLAHG